MSVSIRLTRGGAKKRPFYRVVAADSRRARDGRFIELLGTFDPLQEPPQIRLKLDRVDHWVSQGAQPSETVGKLIKTAKASAAKDAGAAKADASASA